MTGPTRRWIPAVTLSTPETRPLDVLSFGGGQDSTALLHLTLRNAAFHDRYLRGRPYILMSDTGDEHRETYDHVEEMRTLCAEYKVDFEFVTPDAGYHNPMWRSLTHYYRQKNAIGSKAYPKTCTDRLKLKVLYSRIETRIGELYGIETGRKRGLYEYARRFGKLRVMIGIAANEERRVSTGEKDPVYMKKCVEKVYPLIDLGLDRAGCQSLIRAYGQSVPPPSNCRRCPFKSRQELLMMSYDDPEGLDEWIELEENKVAANSHLPLEKNLGVWGRKRLPQVLEEARQKYAHLTIDELRAHRMSHGHCITSKY